MPHCKSCAAPLPAYTSRCEYCGTKNDVDLQGIAECTISRQVSGRTCPLCNIPMETIGLREIDTFSIERCPACMGLFFDPEELNALLDKSVNQVYSIDFLKIHSMNQMGIKGEYRKRAYIRCPVCSQLMNRVNFGARSGVVVDQCRHGVWLDNGELRKLLEWHKAGGMLLHEKTMEERAERLRKEQAKKELKSLTSGMESCRTTPSGLEHTTNNFTPTLMSVAKLLWRIFT